MFEFYESIPVHGTELQSRCLACGSNVPRSAPDGYVFIGWQNSETEAYLCAGCVGNAGAAVGMIRASEAAEIRNQQQPLEERIVKLEGELQKINSEDSQVTELFRGLLT